MKYITCALALFAFASGAVPVYAEEDKKIETVWSVDVDQRLPNSPLALSSPAIVKHAEDTLVVLAGRDGWVHVYDLESGSQERRFSLGTPSDSGALALPNGHVILGDIKGHLFAVDPIEGGIVWKKNLTATFTTPPLALGDDFLIQTGDNALYRFSASGDKRWSFSGSKTALSLYFGAEPLIRDDIIYAVLNNGDAVALKAYTGDLSWKRQTVGSSITSVLSEIKAPLAKPLFLPKLTLEGEQVLSALLVPIFQGKLSVLTAVDGSQSFDMPISLKSSPLLKGENLYMADSLGFLHLYNTTKGNRVWSKKISTHALMGPVEFDGSLWITDNQGSIFRVNMDGDVEASKAMAGRIPRLPIVTDMGLIIRTDRGVMALVK